MKRYSWIYSLIFGIIWFIVGYIVEKIEISVLFGVIPINLSFILKGIEHKNKHKYNAPKTCCARCGINLSGHSFWEIKKIGNKKYCADCMQAILKKGDKTVSHKTPVHQNSVSITNKKDKYVCARCKKTVTEGQFVFIGNHRFCKECANPYTDKPIIHSQKLQKEKTLEIQRLVNVLAQVHKIREINESYGTCAVCKNRFPYDSMIFADGSHYCKNCFESFRYHKQKNTSPTNNLSKQICYEIRGIHDRAFSCIGEISDRLLIGGFKFHKALVGKKNTDSEAFYTEYDDFKKNTEKNSDHLYICIFLSRGSLKVCIRAKYDRTVLGWFDNSDHYFASTRVFTEAIGEEVYNNNCSVDQIDNIRPDSDFFENWQ